MPTSNFAFLSAHDAQLAQLGAWAERYFRDDPGTAIFKLRQFAELLSKTVAAHHALYLGERETFEETLRRLSFERIVPKEAADVFHALRKAGNRAAHETTANHSDALSALKLARQLGIWFHRTYRKRLHFKPGPFVPPREPIDASASWISSPQVRTWPMSAKAIAPSSSTILDRVMPQSRGHRWSVLRILRTIADPIGRAETIGRPVLWRLKE